MAPGDQLFGADRVVAYLPEAVDSLADLDGSRESRIRSKIEGFKDSPAGAFEKHPREHAGQIKDRNSNMRAFGTWCQNADLDVEVCIIHDVYRKENEDRYWRQLEDYQDEGADYYTKFQTLTPAEYEDWKEEILNDDDFIIVTN